MSCGDVLWWMSYGGYPVERVMEVGVQDHVFRVSTERSVVSEVWSYTTKTEEVGDSAGQCRGPRSVGLVRPEGRRNDVEDRFTERRLMFIFRWWVQGCPGG